MTGTPRNGYRVAIVLFAAVVVAATVGPPAIAAGTAPADDATADGTEPAETTDLARLHSSLRGATGPTEVVVKLESVDRTRLATAPDARAMLQRRAERTQQPVVDLARRSPGVDVLNRLWVANLVVLEVDVGSGAIWELRRMPEVEAVARNVDVVPLGARAGSGGHAARAQSAVHRPHPGPSELGDGGTGDAAPGGSDAVDTTYGLDMVDAPEAWDRYDTHGEGATVAVLDTGVDPDHPDIDLYSSEPGNETYPGGYVELTDEGVVRGVEPSAGDHGTHVSGTATGSDASGEYVGVAPNARLIHGNVFARAAGFAAVVQGIQWAVQRDADVVSMSLGVRGGGFLPLLIDPIRNAQAAGTVVVASAGNSGGRTSSPANVYETIAVGAVNEDRDVADFSAGERVRTRTAWGRDAPDDWPRTYVQPDLTAPGVGVKSTVPDGAYAEYDGTSMSAPHVAGTVALLRSVEPSATPEQIKTALRRTAVHPEGADAPKDTDYGSGIVNAAAAIAELRRMLATGTVRGQVVVDGEPVPNALVETDGNLRVRTDADGRFTASLPAGTTELRISGVGVATTTRTVTVAEDEVSEVTLSVPGDVAAAIREQPRDAVQAGETVRTRVRVGNAERLTVTLEGDYPREAATLLVDGEPVPFGEAVALEDGFRDVDVAVRTGSEASGAVQLRVTVANGESTTTVAPRATEVFEMFAQVGFVASDPITPFAEDALGTLRQRLGDRYRISHVPATGAASVVDEYDAFVVHDWLDDSDVAAFVAAATAEDVGLVLLGDGTQWSDGIRGAAGASGWPASVSRTFGGEGPVRYRVQRDHPILDGVAEPGESVTVREGSAHSWASGLDDATVVATVGTDAASGAGIVVDEDRTAVLLASMGRSFFSSQDSFTPASDRILANAVRYVATESADEGAARAVRATPSTAAVADASGPTAAA